MGRARRQRPGRLPWPTSGEYLRTLLAKVPRVLTLKEIGQQFYKNAAFPLVPSSEDIRRAISQTLSGSDPYEVVDEAARSSSSRRLTSCPSAPWNCPCARRPAALALACRRT